MMKRLTVGSLAALFTLGIIFSAHAWRTERTDIEFTGESRFTGPVSFQQEWVDFLKVRATGVQADQGAILALTASEALVGTMSVTAAVVQNLSVPGSLIVGGYTISPYSVTTDAATTNGEVVAISAPLVIVTPSGQADGFTNTVTLANPPAPGFAVVVAVATSSNLLTVADSGNVSLASAFLGGSGDTLSLVAVSTSAWVEVARSNN
jgi:hypothetical protein